MKIELSLFLVRILFCNIISGYGSCRCHDKIPRFDPGKYSRIILFLKRNQSYTGKTYQRLHECLRFYRGKKRKQKKNLPRVKFVDVLNRQGTNIYADGSTLGNTYRQYDTFPLVSSTPRCALRKTGPGPRRNCFSFHISRCSVHAYAASAAARSVHSAVFGQQRSPTAKTYLD